MSTRHVLLSAAILGLMAAGALGAVYLPPVGGWTYNYEGGAAAHQAIQNTLGCLDGHWMRSSNSDEWDGTTPGVGRPGGVMVMTEAATTYLRVQDTGDPRDYGMPDPGSNRKIYLLRKLHTQGDTSLPTEVTPTFLDTGVTLSFRARVSTKAPLDDLHPAGGGGVAPWPAGGDGYEIHDGGKGTIGIRQEQGDKIISFSLIDVPQTGLTMNRLVGTTPSGDVDTGDSAGTVNLLPLDPTVWHEFWIAIQADGSGVGTHQVDIYMDGSLTPTTFLVTAGNGNEDAGGNYITLGQGATPQSGAVDIDFFAYIEGAHAAPEPATLALLALGLGAVLARRRR